MNKISIVTERLLLREIKIADAEAMFQYRSDPQIYKFQNWKPRTLKEVSEFISSNIAKIPNTPNTWYQVGIYVKETNNLAGDIGLHFIGSDNMQVEIGYTLSLEHQSKGYATEAVIGIINYLFNNLHKHRIIASLDPDNSKSIALLERIGLRKEAHFKKSLWINNEWVDDVVYAILKEEWLDQEKPSFR